MIEIMIELIDNPATWFVFLSLIGISSIIWIVKNGAKISNGSGSAKKTTVITLRDFKKKR